MLTIVQDGAVTILSMQDVAKRNVLSAAMIAGLAQGIQLLPSTTRVVVLRAAPECPVWCAGFDIGALGPGVDPLAPDAPLMQLFHTVRDCPVPVVAMVRGGCWGGGADLALRCDLLIADTTCTLAFTPGRIGLPYDTDGLRHVLHRAGLALAMEMFVTGQPVDAARALQAGLINQVTDPDALEATTMGLARQIAALAPLSVQSAKAQLRALARATVVPPDVQAVLDEGRARALGSDDYRAGVAGFLARRPVEFRGQ